MFGFIRGTLGERAALVVEAGERGGGGVFGWVIGKLAEEETRQVNNACSVTAVKKKLKKMEEWGYGGGSEESHNNAAKKGRNFRLLTEKSAKNWKKMSSCSGVRGIRRDAARKGKTIIFVTNEKRAVEGQGRKASRKRNFGHGGVRVGGKRRSSKGKGSASPRQDTERVRDSSNC